VVAVRRSLAVAELGVKVGERETVDLTPAGEPRGRELKSMAGGLGTGAMVRSSGTS
jgi:hypothetical protein